MKRCKSNKSTKLLAVFLSICMIFSVCSVPTGVLADDGTAATATEKGTENGTNEKGKESKSEAEGENGKGSTKAGELTKTGEGSGSLTMQNHSIVWLNGSSSTNINGNNLTITPNGNGDASVTARITYSCGGNEGVEKGKAVIRIPRYIFKDRNGNPVGDFELSIPRAPTTGGATSFNYFVDTKNDDDPSDDEIVISNYKDIPEGGFFMRTDLVWKFNPLDVADEFTNDKVKVSFSTQGNGGGNPLEVDSNTLSIKVLTDVKVNSISKSAGEKKEKWQDAWGPKPADADDYYYVVWNLKLSILGSYSTSPFKVDFEDFPGAIDREGNTSPADNNKGEVVAWANYSYASSNKPTDYGTGHSTDYKQGTLADMNSETVVTANTREEVRSSECNYIFRDVVMRYPKNNIPAQGETPTVKNGFKATVTTPEGKVVEKSTIAEYKYQRVSIDVDYQGDRLDIYKRQRAGNGLSTVKSEALYPGGFNMLKNGTAIEADWSIGVKNMAWRKTENGTKEYDTVLRDGMMYVAGERLNPQDYELTKFYPVQYDVYAPVNNEETGVSLGVSTDYAKDYKPITVEVKDAAGNWSSYGTLTKLNEDTYKWDGPGAKTEKYTATAIANAKVAIALPEGTQDIRFTHTDSKYGVEYNMGLYYKLYPTDHLMGLTGSGQTSFDLMNINEAWGAQDNGQGKKEIFTAGNKFNNTSTPGIVNDVGVSDMAEFGGVDKVAHDYASHRFTMINPTGNFTKSMGAKTNNTAKERVEIRVNLTWDYYFNYSRLGVDINDAIDANIIKEQRNSDFYDLLPPGVTVDLSSIKATTYSSRNVDDKVIPACDYTVEMIDNWRDSGRTMMIVHVYAPEGYRNFAKSTTYVDTGFKLSFTMHDSWDNIESNGTNIANRAAYYSKDGSVVKGVSDTGEGSGEPLLFEKLAGDEGDSNLKENVRYAYASTSVNVPRAAQMGLTKMVKAAQDTDYNINTSVPATGRYSYQLRFAMEEGSSTTDIILYDVLEKAYDNNGHWQGSFKGIDVSQIKRTFPNTDIKIYYSTAKDIGDLQASGGTDYTDLKNTDIWTNKAPADLSTVTAVAIDVSKDKNGNTVTYKGPLAMNATISMQAPANYKENVDDPATTVNEAKYAYNQAFMKQGTERIEGTDITKVGMAKPDLQIKKSSDPASGSVDKPAGVLAGDTINYTIDVTNKNKAEAAEGVKVEDTLPGNLVIDENAMAYYFGDRKSETKTIDGTGRVTAAVKGQKISFTVDKLAALETVHLIIPVRVKGTAAAGSKIVNSAEITEFNGKEWDEYKSNETHHKVSSTTLNIPVSKRISGLNRPEQFKKEFTFTLENENGAPMPAGNGNVKTIKDVGNTSFDSIEYTRPGDYKYTVKETEGTEAGYGYDQTVHHITVHVEAQNGNLTASWEDADGEAGDTSIIFKNRYQPKSAKLAIPVTKTLSGDPVPAGHTENFNFELEPVSADSPLPDSGTNTVSINGLGQGTKTKSTSFDEITFSEPGTYLYQIKEIIGNTPGYRYAFDASTHTVRVVVSDNNGQLKVSWTGDSGAGSDVLFNNEYAPTADIVSFNVTKEITGNARVEKYKKAFKFNLSKPVYEGPYDYAANNEELPMPAASSTTIGDEGNGVLGQIAIRHAGTYTYTITEQDSGEKGYTYDTSQWKAIVVAKDVGGEIKSTINYRKSTGTDENTKAAKFVNRYKPAETEAQLEIKKAVKGKVPQGGDKNFSFKIEAKGNAPIPAGGATVSIKGEGTVSTGAIKFTEAGTYKYNVSEIKGSDKGYIYSDDLYEVTVEVTDNDGSLEKEITYLRNNNKVDSISFENKYKPDSAMFYPAVSKTITGKARNDNFLKAFTFELEAVNNEPLPEGNGSTTTVTDEGDASFGKITFNEAGTYRYKIRERDTGERGYVYSEEEYALEITVTDENGVLKADAVYKNKQGHVKNVAAFENKYNPGTVSNIVSVKKTITGHNRSADNLKTFEFELEPQGKAPMPKAGGEKASVLDEGNAKFGEITYDETGSYKYTVREKAGRETGYTYSEDVYELTVDVVDNDGILEKVVSYKRNGETTDKIEFTNNYRAKETSVVLSAEKVIEGDKRGEKDKRNFEFELSGDSDSPMPAAKGGNIARIKDKGTAGFGEIVYNKAGDYRYKVTEKNTAEKGYSYDSSEYAVTVKVIDVNGFLKAQTSYIKDGKDVGKIVFTNSYKADKDKKAASARTFDRFNLSAWLGAMLLSGFGVLIIVRRRRKEKI